MATNEERRYLSEQKLLRAFDTVLKRDGLSKVGVNSVVKEAGVGKGLLYDYFGDLDGLAEAWTNWSHFYPTQDEITKCSETKYELLSKAAQVGYVNINYAQMLKNNPIAIELLRSGVVDDQPLKSILKKLKDRLGKSHEELINSDPYFSSPDAMSLLMILHAACNYIALRSTSAPNFNGIELDTEAGWNAMMDMINRVSLLLPDDE